jgi:nitrate reductase NapE component
MICVTIRRPLLCQPPEKGRDRVADQTEPSAQQAKKDETLAFLFLAFVLFPMLAVVTVVWMQHLMFGPPGV